MFAPLIARAVRRATRPLPSIFENADIDRRTLSQHGMQPRVMNHGCIGSENRRLHRWMARVGKAPTERDLNNVFEIKLNFIGLLEYRRID